MVRKCIICKKELSDDNKGFLCQYHKDKAKETAKKAGSVVAGAGAVVVATGKTVLDHKEEIIAAAKKATDLAREILKSQM